MNENPSFLTAIGVLAGAIYAVCAVCFGWAIHDRLRWGAREVPRRAAKVAGLIAAPLVPLALPYFVFCAARWFFGGLRDLRLAFFPKKEPALPEARVRR